MPPLPALTPVPFAEAIAWASARQVVLPESYYGQLQGLARSMAFSVAGIAKLDQLQTVLDSLAANLESGESFGQWKNRVREGEIPLDLPAHRIENIFRTNTQGHYGRGRCEQQKRTLADRPYFLYDAVNDSRVRLTHAAMDGFVARYDDPTWRVWTPPAGYQCRCRRIALSEAQAKRFIAADAKRLANDPELAKDRATAQPDKGWDYDPCAEPDEGLRRAWARWVGKAHPALAEVAQALDDQLKAALLAFEAARQDCLAFGKINNRERLILLEENTGKKLAAEDGGAHSVNFTATMLSLLDDERLSIRMIHNHPSDGPLSRADYLTLSRPGVSGIEAIGHAGSRYSAMIGPHGRIEAQKFGYVMDAIDNAIYAEMRPLVTSENIKFLQWAHFHFFALALDELGLIRYSPALTAGKLAELEKFKTLANRGIAAAKRGGQNAL